MEEKGLHVRIVPMTADHLDEVAELERICFTTPWSRNMLAEEVDNYLQTNLGLNLNQKTAVIPIGNPVEFVGRKISPVKIELRRQTTLGMKKHLRYVQDAYAAGEIDLDYALSVITSYRGLFKDVTSDAFLEKMLDEFVLSRPALEA